MTTIDAAEAISRVYRVAVVTFTDLRKEGGRFVSEPGHQVRGEVTILRDGALSVDDPETGRMVKMIALGLVDSIVDENLAEIQ